MPLACASVRSAPGRIASVKSALRRSAWRKFAPERSAPGSFDRRRSAPSRFALRRMAPLRFTPPRSARDRSAPVRSARAPPSFPWKKRACASSISATVLPLCRMPFVFLNPMIVPPSLVSAASILLKPEVTGKPDHAPIPVLSRVLTSASTLFSVRPDGLWHYDIAVMNHNNHPRHSLWLAGGFAFVLFFLCLPTRAAAQTQAPEDEIVANLAGGRVIVHVARDGNIVFAAINQPVEAGGVPPRVVETDSTHVAVLLGASEWRLPADPNPVRLDRNFERIH